MSDLIHNERTKLTATLLNAAAAGLIVTGAIAPAIASLYGLSGMNATPRWLVATGSFACLAVSVCLHLSARAILGRLR